MKFGVTMFLTDYSIGPTELAGAVEERGLESLFFPEHTHIPTSRRTPRPGGGELPPEYSHTLDPFVALGAAAAATESLLIGTGICLVIERDPITLAKEVASLDFISGGRFLFGIGGGWNQEEMENHGTNPAQRRPRGGGANRCGAGGWSALESIEDALAQCLELTEKQKLDVEACVAQYPQWESELKELLRLAGNPVAGWPAGSFPWACQAN